MRIRRKLIAILGLSASIIVLAGIARTASSADLNGVWQATSPRSAGGADRPPLTPRAQADLEAYDPLNDPVIRCVPGGFPRTGLIIYPFEIVQTESLVVFLYESFGMVRRIYMDGRELPGYLPPARSGYSVGRWDGDDLVVTTTRVAPGLLSGGGLSQYGDVQVVERYMLSEDGQTLAADVTVTAAETLTAPWTRHFTWELDPGGMVFEWACDPSDSRF